MRHNLKWIATDSVHGALGRLHTPRHVPTFFFFPSPFRIGSGYGSAPKDGGFPFDNYPWGFLHLNGHIVSVFMDSGAEHHLGDSQWLGKSQKMDLGF